MGFVTMVPIILCLVQQGQSYKFNRHRIAAAVSVLSKADNEKIDAMMAAVPETQEKGGGDWFVWVEKGEESGWSKETRGLWLPDIPVGDIPESPDLRVSNKSGYGEAVDTRIMIANVLDLGLYARLRSFDFSKVGENGRPEVHVKLLQISPCFKDGIDTEELRKHLVAFWSWQKAMEAKDRDWKQREFPASEIAWTWRVGGTLNGFDDWVAHSWRDWFAKNKGANASLTTQESHTERGGKAEEDAVQELEKLKEIQGIPIVSEDEDEYVVQKNVVVDANIDLFNGELVALKDHGKIKAGDVIIAVRHKRSNEWENVELPVYDVEERTIKKLLKAEEVKLKRPNGLSVELGANQVIWGDVLIQENRRQQHEPESPMSALKRGETKEAQKTIYKMGVCGGDLKYGDIIMSIEEKGGKFFLWPSQEQIESSHENARTVIFWRPPGK